MLRIPLPWQLGSSGRRFPSPTNSTAATSLTGGADISLQEAVDLLHKLREETAQVQAIYAGSGGVSSVLRGILRPPIDDGLWSVASQQETTGSALSFDVSSSTVRKFGDESTMQGASSFPFRLRLVSALSFGFADGSTLFLFELDQDQPAAIYRCVCSRNSVRMSMFRIHEQRSSQIAGTG